MSAYGTVIPEVQRAPLQARLYPLSERARTQGRSAILFVPFSSEAMRARCDVRSGDGNDDEEGNARSNAVPKELADVLRAELNAELELGITYPQRGPMDESEFATYFTSYDLIVGIFVAAAPLVASGYSSNPPSEGDRVPPMTVEKILASNHDSSFWSKELAAAYYIKPNYPGRSSHLCNAGFLVPSTARGMGSGTIAGRSFLHYGPAAGYRGSVFNLVYEDNVASMRIWDGLGFQKVGKVPGAGRKKGKDGGEDTFVDAWVVYGDFAKLGVP